MTATFKDFVYRRKLEELSNKRSQDGSTCLVSLYVPPHRALSDFVSELTDEIGTAANIRSKTTRKNVTTALQSLMGRLKQMGSKSPPSGLAIFTGVTSSGKNEFHMISPPNPISKKLYVCDSFFHTTHLADHLVEKDAYGLITLDGTTATIAILRGTHLDVKKTTRSGAPKKHKAGGQSSVRFQRLHEEAVLRYLKRVADYAKDLFIENPESDIKGLIIGGPGSTKERFAEADYLDNRLKAKLLKIVDIGYAADVQGMRELVAQSTDVLKGVRYVEEKKLVQNFLDLLYRESGLVSYGEEEVRQLLITGAVAILLLSDKLSSKRANIVCSSCKFTKEITVTTKEMETLENNLETCPSCGSSLSVESYKDIIEDLGELAEQSGASIEIVSTETEEGAQLYSFGGIAAILRYKAEF
ncbi:MAG: peptide chain release factor aRF-1 [Promethearchaeota archaeon]